MKVPLASVAGTAYMATTVLRTALCRIRPSVVSTSGSGVRWVIRPPPPPPSAARSSSSEIALSRTDASLSRRILRSRTKPAASSVARASLYASSMAAATSAAREERPLAVAGYGRATKTWARVGTTTGQVVRSSEQTWPTLQTSP